MSAAWISAMALASISTIPLSTPWGGTTIEVYVPPALRPATVRQKGLDSPHPLGVGLGVAFRMKAVRSHQHSDEPAELIIRQLQQAAAVERPGGGGKPHHPMGPILPEVGRVEGERELLVLRHRGVEDQGPQGLEGLADQSLGRAGEVDLHQALGYRRPSRSGSVEVDAVMSVEPWVLHRQQRRDPARWKLVDGGA